MDFRKNSASATDQGNVVGRSPVAAMAEIVLFILGLAAVVFVVFIVWLTTRV
jgi:hypothetical protein